MPVSGMNFRMTNVAAIMEAEEQAMQRSSTTTTRRISANIQKTWRASVRRSGLGSGLAKSIRRQARPRRGNSNNPSAVVYSNSQKFLSPHQFGEVVTAKGSRYLAIPVSRVGGKRRRRSKSLGKFTRLTTRNWETLPENKGKSLVFLKTAKGGVLVDSEDGNVQFALQPTVSIRKRLSLFREAEGVLADLEADLVLDWNKTARQELGKRNLMPVEPR